MALSDIFQDSAIRQTLAIFSDAEKDAIEQALFDKNGKPYIKCLVRGKDVQAKKEEVVRQLWLHRLLNHYPAISETDLLALPFHPIAKDAETAIIQAVQSAHDARRQAHALLKAAKRAVEIAIEDSEAVALEYLADLTPQDA